MSLPGSWTVIASEITHGGTLSVDSNDLETCFTFQMLLSTAGSSPPEDAGTYTTKLPKAEHEAAEGQAAMEAMILVAKLGGPTMFARIAGHPQI
jgi:hypothetical protein